MSMQNPIADMLTRVRNAQSVLMHEVSMPASKIKESIAAVLKDEGYIVDYSVSNLDNVKKQLTIKLKYYNGAPVIESIKQVSKPSRRVYESFNDLKRVCNGFGTYIVSTSKGVMASREARKNNLGGEVLVEVY